LPKQLAEFKMIEYIQESTKKHSKQRREWTVFDNVQVFIKDRPPEDVSIEEIILQLEELIPTSFTSGLDVIYVGEFEQLTQRSVEAAYEDGAIYVSNNQPNEYEFVESIIHEIAHSLEEISTSLIYADGEIEREFLSKRKRLWSIMKSHDLVGQQHYASFEQVEYSEELDMFFYEDIGYELMSSLTMGLFMSPYGATSLREYFANAFEHFFLSDDKKYVKQISPAVYNKLVELSLGD